MADILSPSLSATGAAALPPGVTMGVEEEFFLVNPANGRPEPQASEVLGSCGHRMGKAESGPQFKQELLASQVEVASGINTELEQLADQLLACRRQLAAEAEARGLRLAATGTPGMTAAPAPMASDPRYERMAETFAGMTEDHEISGCHVHVAVPDGDTAVAVINHLRVWLPTLLALSTNSPFCRGRDTGFGSWRMIKHNQFPGAGVPPFFSSYTDYTAALERLVAYGTLVDQRQNFWLARPSSRFPTVEMRVADSAATVDDAVLQAALSRALVRTALRAVEEGREPPRVDSQTAAASVWTAARYGLHGPGIHPGDERRTAATNLVSEMMNVVAPALEDTGDLRRVRRLLSNVLLRGTGADRQRTAGFAGERREGPCPDQVALTEFLRRQTVQAPYAETEQRPASVEVAGAPERRLA